VFANFDILSTTYVGVEAINISAYFLRHAVVVVVVVVVKCSSSRKKCCVEVH